MSTHNHPLRHLAIIMDGNGRWAKARNLPRTKGHEKGAEVIREITAFCADHPAIQTVTFYAFSTENWKRPKAEVDFLMRLLERYLKQELALFRQERIRFQAIGNIDELSPSLQEQIDYMQAQTAHYDRLTHILALNYGARSEITQALKTLVAQNKPVTQDTISSALQTPYSDIDLLIRTSGEQRLSNFLLWQASYAELYFTQTLWPDFTASELSNIIEDYLKRERRYGGLG